jgi:hypothetical protein
MLITFSCDTFENVVMFEKVAKQLLILMGNTAVVPGAILAKDIPQALSHLESGIKQEQQNIPRSNSKDDENEELEISLAHRAIPLINMLKSAMKHQCNIMWA